jgi:integrase
MYTGLAYSDSQAFDIGQYKQDGEQWITTGERIKTGSPYVSVLLPPVVAVLEKYGWKVPKMDYAVYSRQLKMIGVMADIKTRMHSHLARHTFATNMLSNDVKIQNVSKMLGHKNLQQTMRYAKVLAQDVREDFDMIAEKMKNRK